MPRFLLLGLLASVALILASCAGSAPKESAAATPEPEEGLIQVGILAIDGVYNSELMAPYDIFHHTVFHAKPGMRVFTVGRRPGSIKTFEGIEMAVDHDLESCPPLDVLVVPSAEGSMSTDLRDSRLIDWVRKRGREARFCVSICDGAFLLAEAGLLEGRRCTTFPGDIAEFRKRYPHLNVLDGVRYVADGPMVTGVGGAKSYAPALHVVEAIYGEEIARKVGRGMVIPWDASQVRHLSLDSRMPESDAPTCYLPGDRIDPGVAVEDASGRRLRLSEIVAEHPEAKAVVLFLMAGAEADAEGARGGIWCEDTFSEVANIRHLILDYSDRVLFLGVACPPIHHEKNFGFAEGSFLGGPDDDPAYLQNRKVFVDATLRLQEREMIPFEHLYFDPRFRLLADPKFGEASPASGPRRPWQGRFKWFEDTQTYGTPTIWILTSGLEVKTPPFFMNVYESPGRKLRFQVPDVRNALDRVLEGAGS